MDKTIRFIERSNKIHNYEFDYSSTVFEKSTIRVKITCKKHGIFEQYPYNHLRGCKCPFCIIEKQKLNLEKAIEIANEIHNNKYDYSLIYEQYKRNKQKVDIICPLHGIFRVSMNNHISKETGCPKCYEDNRFLTTEEYISRCKIKDIDNIFDYSLVNYINRDIKIDIICKKHNTIFNILPFHHLSANQGCKYCRLEKYKQTRIKNGNQIADEKLTDWQIYRKKVVNITNRYRKNLFQNWNGYDYYDDEYIKENLSLPSKDKNYPTIDHKISVYYGFINNIEPEEISNIENLCITKRKINSSKNKDIEFNF